MRWGPNGPRCFGPRPRLPIAPSSQSFSWSKISRAPRVHIHFRTARKLLAISKLLLSRRECVASVHRLWHLYLRYPHLASFPHQHAQTRPGSWSFLHIFYSLRIPRSASQSIVMADKDIVAEHVANVSSNGQTKGEPNRLALAQVMSEDEFLAVEKRLKRKLDVRLLGCVWLIFVLNYLDRVSSPFPSTATSFCLSISAEQHRSSQSCRHAKVTSLNLNTVCYLCRSLVRWICSHATPFQHLPCTFTAVNIFANLHGCLGNYLHLHRCYTQRWWTLCYPIPPRFRGSGILSWGVVPHFIMVSPLRNGFAKCRTFFRLPAW